MFKNYLKIALRNLIKHRKYSVINILGLSIGVACFVMIMLWVQYELSYDAFHENADNTYIIYRKQNDKLSAVSSQMLAPTIKSELPEVIEAASYVPLPESFKPYFQRDEKGFEENIGLVKSQFFNIFSFEFVEGNAELAFNDPNSVVLTEDMKQKYFGDEDAIGESLSLTFLGKKSELKVTGILKNMPHNTHIQREVFIPIDFIKKYGINWETWNNFAAQTYVLTKDKIDIHKLEKSILECEKRHSDTEYANLSYSLLLITKIHLHSNNVEFFAKVGDIKYVYIFSVFAGIILLIACMNYMNLTNAFSLKRVKEIGVKKVVGARRGDLIQQYIGETFIMTSIAIVIAIFLVELFLPELNRLLGKELTVNYFNPQFIITILSTLLVTSLISGIYPAIFITRFKPIQILKNKFNSNKNGISLQKGLIVFQFALSTIIIICTIIVFGQLNYISGKNLGYDKENIVTLQVTGDISDRYEVFRNSLTMNSNIINITRSEPVDANSMGSTEGIDWIGKEKKFSAWMLNVDLDFNNTYKIDMNKGRFYSREYPSDKENSFVINEAAAKEMGFETPIGEELTVWGRKGKIIGVTNNFNFHSLHQKVEPLILRIPNEAEQKIYFRQISIRIKPNSVEQSLATIQNAWSTFLSGEPFKYSFVDENLQANYNAELRMGEIFKYFSFLAIFIACLGLYGLTAFMIERKIKDIGVHRVLGASISKIVFLLSRKYMLWIIVSNIIAFPVSYYFMNNWLQDFAYSIDITVFPFLLASILSLIIAIITVSWQAIKAANANPVESLKYE